MSEITQPQQEYSAQGVPIPLHWQRIVVAVWSGQAISLLTSGAAGYALIWYLTETTASPMILALSTLMYFLPMGLLGPFAGAIVDRFNRKHVMIVADLGIAAAAVVMAVVIIAGFTSVPLVLAMLLVRSIGTAFHSPAMMAVMPLLVPDRHLVRITSLDQGLAGITNIVAPALGIFFYTAFGLQIALFADAFGALIACGLLALVTIPDVHMASEDRTGILHEMVDGVNEVHEHRGLGLLFVFMALGIIAFMPMASLFPLMTYTHFGGDGYDAALVEAIWGIGFVVGSIVLGIWGGGKRLLMLIMVSILVQGALTFVLGLMPQDGFVLFAALCLPLAIAGAFFNGPINAIIARKIKPEKLGRVMALMGTVMSLSAPIGLMIAGPIAEFTGVPFWFLASGAGLVAIPIIAMLFPSIRALDREEAVPDREEA